MSFILDALRKSDNERRKNAPPGLADVRIASVKQSRPHWVPLVAVLLGANFIVLALLWFGWYRPGLAGSSTNSAGMNSSAASDAMTFPDRKDPLTGVIGQPEVRNLSKEVGRTQADEAFAAKSSAAVAGPAAAGEQQPAPESLLYANLPTMNEAILAGIVTIPPLHLDIHVFSESSAERFVFINMAKYREGETLEEGPTLEQITDAGVVLNHQGNRFLLARQ